MCVNIRPSKRKEFVGYKVVTKCKGEYYSPCTGYKYPHNGAIERMDIIRPTLRAWLEKGLTVKLSEWYHYNPNMLGYTAVFKHKEVAIDKVESWMFYYGLSEKGHSLCVVKIRLYGKLKNGDFDHTPVVLGNHIEILEEVK